MPWFRRLRHCVVQVRQTMAPRLQRFRLSVSIPLLSVVRQCPFDIMSAVVFASAFTAEDASREATQRRRAGFSVAVSRCPYCSRGMEDIEHASIGSLSTGTIPL
jgi:hypothetical protein